MDLHDVRVPLGCHRDPRNAENLQAHLSETQCGSNPARTPAVAMHEHTHTFTHTCHLDPIRVWLGALIKESVLCQGL